MKMQHIVPARMIASWMVALTLPVILLSGCSKQSDNANKEIKLGFAGTLTGSASFIGVEIQRGAEMAMDEINAQGGVQGHKLSLVTRDDQHEPKNTVVLYRELVEREKVVAMLGAVNSASMLAVTPIVNDSLKVPVICVTGDATAITENEAKAQGKDSYLFRVGMFGTGQANFMVDTAVKKLGYNKVGLLTWTGGWGVTGRGELQRRLKELGLTPVADETYGDSDTDMTPQILKLKQAGAQCILNYGLVRDNAFVIKTKELLSDTTPYISAWVVATPAFWKAVGSAGEGTFASTTVTMDGPQSAERIAFAKKYLERYKEPMLGPVYVCGAYDAIYLYKTAMESHGLEPTQIRQGLENISAFKGLVKTFTRPVFTHDRHNSLTEEDMIFGRWTEGKLLEVKFHEKGAYIEIDAGKKSYINPADAKLR